MTQEALPDRQTEGGRLRDPAGYLLHTEDELSQIAQQAVDLAARLGVGDVMASAFETAGVSMKVRGGAPENAIRDSARALSIKVFSGGRTGSASTSAFTPDAVRVTVEQAIAISREVEPDADTAWADPEWLQREIVNLDLYAPSYLTPSELGRSGCEIEAGAAEAAGRQGCDVRVLQAGASSHEARSALAIGKDFARTSTASHHSRWCVAIAERGGAMARNAWSTTDRRIDRLEPGHAVGETAVGRAARKLGARSIETRSCPVVLDATVAWSLVQEIAGALMGGAQYRKASFLAEGRGLQALADHLDLIEDPLEPFGLASGAYDNEGVGGGRRHIIRAGVVEDLFLSCLSARKLGLKSTGNADGVRNLVLTSRHALEDLLRELGKGLWVTELIGGAVNPVTGAYSKAAAGFWIDQGQIAFPVQDITIAGHLPTLLKQIVALGGDVHRHGAIRTGSILIESMQIAGR